MIPASHDLAREYFRASLMTSLPPSIPTFSTWPNTQSGLLLWQLPVLPWVSLALLLPWAYAQAHIVSFSWKTSCHLLCLDSSNILFPDEHSHWRLWEIIPKHPNPFGDSFSAVPEHLILTTIFHVQQPLFFFFSFCDSLLTYLSLNCELFRNRGQALFLSVSFTKFHNTFWMDGQTHG